LNPNAPDNQALSSIAEVAVGLTIGIFARRAITSIWSRTIHRGFVAAHSHHAGGDLRAGAARLASRSDASIKGGVKPGTGRSMGFYGHYILPRLIDVAMRNKETTRLRSVWIPQACGDVLEVGIGSGLNLRFYSSHVQRVYGFDPSIELQRMARKQAETGPTPVEFVSQSAEEPLPLADASIDTVVLTWTLCSIPNPPKALQEMKRVLRPSGRMIFLEHGRSPDPGVAVWQDRLTPGWKRIGGGCHLNRKVDELITAAGFQITELKTCYLPGPRPMTYTYQGFAQVA
jgi:ubiquinone/menaquinone biosynthesis C-methylase UbiE